MYDSYNHLSLAMLGFLVEVLEKGPPQSSTNSINFDLLRTVSKLVETQHWKQALQILELAVTRSSTLTAPASTIM